MFGQPFVKGYSHKRTESSISAKSLVSTHKRVFMIGSPLCALSSKLRIKYDLFRSSDSSIRCCNSR